MSRSARTAPAFPGESPLRLLHWLQLSPLDAAPPSAQLLSSPVDNSGPRPVQHASTTLAAAGNAATRCQSPEACPPQLREKKCDALFAAQHNHYHAHQSPACQPAACSRHAPCAGSRAHTLSQAWGAQDLVALCVIVARTRCADGGDPSGMTLSAQSPRSTWGCRKHL